ncbi:ZIP family metal transporter [Candidatus Woesearchaeota archaeon]|nr:ZIP family metal transporter [Candidatus Woesearchaeota archaeon]
MVEAIIYTVLSVLIVSAISLIGIFTLSLKEKEISKILIYLVSFSAGALFGDAFIHLLPAVFEKSGFGIAISLYLLFGILFFFVLEKFIHWRHCHVYGVCDIHDHPKALATMNLVGDAVHNVVDGIIIAGSYLASIPLGIATTIAILFHEIPQEIGDFGVLLHSGFTKRKALFFNFFISLTSLLGAVIALVLGSLIGSLTTFIIPFAAGGFIYIAGSDLIPELHKEIEAKKSAMQLLFFVLGILVMLALLLIE